MTATKVNSPPPPCTGKFRTRCRVCKQPAHPSTTEGPNRTCVDGHRPYVGKGRCRRCYKRDQKAGRLPKHSPVKRPPRNQRRQGTPGVQTTPLPAGCTPITPELRSTVPAPCDRCGRIERLRMGPGEALCIACGAAQLLDRSGGRRAYALALTS